MYVLGVRATATMVAKSETVEMIRPSVLLGAMGASETRLRNSMPTLL